MIVSRMSEPSAEDRLDELETRLSFQDDTIASLNEALVQQQLRIARLEKSLRLLIEQVRGNEDDGREYPEEPPPPHY